MVVYTYPQVFYKGQLLWKNSGEAMCIVEVLNIKDDHVEIVYLGSDNTCLWTPKTALFEKHTD